jgi:dihydrolipoamide dehydrogenase
MEVWNTVKRAEEFGVSTTNAKLDWSKVIERKDQIIGHYRSGKEPSLKKLGVDLVIGEAVFTSPETVRVGNKEYTADRFLIGVGSKSTVPPIKGVEHTISSTEMLDLKELPKSLIVIGGGYIGLEFAHIFDNAGVDVTILQRGNPLLKVADRESAQIIQKITEKRGIHVITDADVKQIEKGDNLCTVHFNVGDHPKEISGETVLLSTGRTPNLDGLGLEAAGIKYSKRGIEVNEYLQTTAERIYAAGDCIGGLMLTPVATYEAKVAMRNAFKGNRHKVDYDVVPYSVFTLPPVASVGLTEEAAKEKGIDYWVNRASFNHNGTAVILGEEEGYAKILSEKKSGRIIGAHIVGAHADDLIHEIAIAMKAKLTLQDLSEVIHVHPTMSEALIILAGTESE